MDLRSRRRRGEDSLPASRQGRHRLVVRMHRIRGAVSTAGEEDGRQGTNEIPNPPRELLRLGRRWRGCLDHFSGPRSTTHRFKGSARLSAGDWGTQHCVRAQARRRHGAAAAAGSEEGLGIWRFVRRKEELAPQAGPWALRNTTGPQLNMRPLNTSIISIWSLQLFIWNNLDTINFVRVLTF